MDRARILTLSTIDSRTAEETRQARNHGEKGKFAALDAERTPDWNAYRFDGWIEISGSIACV